MNWQSWLSDLTQSRCVLVELIHADGRLYLATMPYQSTPTDTPANTAYDDLITEMPEISRDESQPVSVGDLAFHTPNAGQLIRYQWDKALIYLGSPDWPKADFKLITTAAIERVLRVSVDRVRVEFSDDNYGLSGVLPAPKVYQEPEGTVLPLIVGMPFNVTPLNTFPAQLEYAVGTYDTAGDFMDDNDYISVLSVRDNGVPVAFTPHSHGRFRLDSPPVGEITASYATGNNWLLSLLTQLTGGDTMNLESGRGFDNELSALKVAALAPQGTTYRELIDTLTRGLNVSVQYVPDGSLEIIHYRMDREPDYVVVADDMVAGTIEHFDSLAAASRITIQYRQNFTVLSSVAGAAADDEDAVALQSEYQQLSLDNPDAVPENELMIETALVELAGAELIAQRLMQLRGVTRYAYRFELFAAGIELRDGDLLDLQHAGWDLSGPALVTKVEYRIGANRVQLEVLM